MNFHIHFEAKVFFKEKILASKNFKFLERTLKKGFDNPITNH